MNGRCLVAVLCVLLTAFSCFLMYAERTKGNTYTVSFVFGFKLLYELLYVVKPHDCLREILALLRIRRVVEEQLVCCYLSRSKSDIGHCRGGPRGWQDTFMAI